MTIIILLFGTLIILGSAVLLVRPSYIFNLITKYRESLSLHFFAVIIRIIPGAALVIGASESKYPIVLQIFGWLLISAAIALSVMGRKRFKNLITWSVNLAPLFNNLAGVFAIIFGGFLIYAVV